MESFEISDSKNMLGTVFAQETPPITITSVCPDTIRCCKGGDPTFACLARYELPTMDMTECGGCHPPTIDPTDARCCV